MTFTTPTFLLFLALVFTIHWRFDRDGQNWVLLAASLVFYGWWDWRFLFLLIAVASSDFLIALALDKQEARSKRKVLLAISLVSNLGTLGFFKYYDFFAASLRDALSNLGVEVSPLTLELTLPIGISFYTFQALSYTIDVYRGHMKPVRSLRDYLTFILFFPQLVAGPIERARDLLPQFEAKRTFDYRAAVDGCQQALWGFFKKMVVADTLAQFANAAYGDVSHADGGRLLWATFAFAFQIYCDFSGYTDIAIGTARMFGIKLSRNFVHPYFARDIPEFWGRWHLSLSTWFRDYLYLPLGGNRTGRVRRAVNVMLVFVVSGFWHGANATFLVWGALHGVGYFLIDFHSRSTPRDERGFLPAPRELAAMILTFAFVSLAWVFFRAASVGQALTVVAKIGTAVAHLKIGVPAAKIASLIAVLLSVEWITRTRLHPLAGIQLPTPVRWGLYYALVAAILYLAPLGYTPFIYFQF